eukprot:scaffold13002_cov125-Isochrysis_galbana.AAC.18
MASTGTPRASWAWHSARAPERAAACNAACVPLPSCSADPSSSAAVRIRETEPGPPIVPTAADTTSASSGSPSPASPSSLSSPSPAKPSCQLLDPRCGLDVDTVVAEISRSTAST